MFTADYLRGTRPSFTALCRRYNISRKTGYKWIRRYESGGLDGLDEQSRQPKSHPGAIPCTVRKAIFELRDRYTITLGPKKIQAKLTPRFPDQRPASLTSIDNILKRAGLVKPRRKRTRVSPFDHPLAAWLITWTDRSTC